MTRDRPCPVTGARRLHGGVSRFGAVVGVCAVLLAGCAGGSEPEPGPTAVPASPAPGADLVCGMARADIEAVTGSTVERTEGELTVVNGVGSGTCTAWAPEDVFLDGLLFHVELSPAASEAGARARAELAGQVVGKRVPEIVYSSREGALWVLDFGEGRLTGLGKSYVFIGDTVVMMVVDRGAEDRNRPGDQLALTEQIAASLGLEPGGTGS